MKYLILVFTMAVSFPSMAEFTCNGHLKYGLADKQGSVDQKLCKGGFAVGYNYHYKAPIWVAYKLTIESVLPNNGRGNNPFKPDTELLLGHRASLWDFKYSNYDRGHLAPRSAVDFSPHSRDESFLLSNIAAQDPKLNRNGWKGLENYVSGLVAENGEIFVVSGTIFDGYNRTIGRNNVYVPSHFYKIVYIPYQAVMVAWIIPNQPVEYPNYIHYQVSVDDVERRTGLDFHNLLSNAYEAPMEKCGNCLD